MNDIIIAEKEVPLWIPHHHLCSHDIFMGHVGMGSMCGVGCLACRHHSMVDPLPCYIVTVDMVHDISYHT